VVKRTVGLVFALSVAVAGVLATPGAAAAAPAATAAAPPAATGQLRADNARLAGENTRLHQELDVLEKFAPHEKAWWEQSIFESLLVGLILALVGFYYTWRQTRAALTMDLLKLWLDVWSTSNSKGIVPLRNDGLGIDQDALDSLEKLGNLYEIIAIAVANNAVDRTALESYGMRAVNRDFRTLLDTNAKKTGTTDQQKQARLALEKDLQRWDRGATWA